MKVIDHKKNFNKKNYHEYILSGDIGGTNTNLGIFGRKKSKLTLLFSFHMKSAQLRSLVTPIKSALAYAHKHKINIARACIGAAGIISSDISSCSLTNLTWSISVPEILKKTALKSCFLINDFEAIGYGINTLKKQDIITINEGKARENQTKAALGAGTGLGKSILLYDKAKNAHIPIPSEGGHADFPVQNVLENKLVEFIKKKRKVSYPLTYERLLSGAGLENIYLYLRHIKKYRATRYTKEIDTSKEKTVLISKYMQKDNTCRKTFRLFARFYARCAKNFVLDTLSTGGLYLAGGIAEKNPSIFMSKDFLREFKKAEKLMPTLRKIPIYLIKNYNISLYGAAFAVICQRP
jgi:glucokinase